MEPLQPQPGSTIAPKNAVGRGETTARARRELADGNNLALNDPRRMGKTVWLDLFCADPGEGLIAIKIDFEGVQTSNEFLIRVVEALRKYDDLPSKAMSKLKALFDGVEEVSVAATISVKKGVATRTPTELLADTVRSVDENLEAGSLLVIAMDEVPIAIANIASREGPEAANHLLQTLRSLRRRGSSLRWIVCGSVGFHHILRRCNATEGVINDLVNLPLGPLQEAEADELSRRLLLGIGRHHDDPAVAALVEHSGSIPFLVHALAHMLHDTGSGAVTDAEVGDAFAAYMDDRDGSRSVTHLVTRLDPLYGDQAGTAEAILDRVALEGTVSVAEFKAQAGILDDLIDDHYLVERDREVRWRYAVLQRIWMHRRRLR